MEKIKREKQSRGEEENRIHRKHASKIQQRQTRLPQNGGTLPQEHPRAHGRRKRKKTRRNQITTPTHRTRRTLRTPTTLSGIQRQPPGRT